MTYPDWVARDGDQGVISHHKIRRTRACHRVICDQERFAIDTEMRVTLKSQEDDRRDRREHEVNHDKESVAGLSVVMFLVVV